MNKESFTDLVRFSGGLENATIISSFVDRLTPTGFEQYVTDFFKLPEYGFSSYRNGWFDDGGIDIKAARSKEDWSNQYLIVQCKKWAVYHIDEWEVAKFYGKVSDISRQHDCLLVFVTTSWFTPNAKAFCESKNIRFADYSDLLNFNAELPLETWISAISDPVEKELYLAPAYVPKAKSVKPLPDVQASDVSGLAAAIIQAVSAFVPVVAEKPGSNQNPGSNEKPKKPFVPYYGYYRNKAAKAKAAKSQK